MKYLVLAFALGAVVGHFGPITVAKWTAHSTASGLHMAGKTLDTAQKMLK